jgi:hypothetical protein
MNAANRTVILKKYLEDVINVLDSKGKAYSGTDNVNANIESTAKSLKITKYQVWSVFFKKHIDCIFNSIADNPEEPHDNTESLDGRITDAINYLLILKTMLIDDGLNSYKDETKVYGIPEDCEITFTGDGPTIDGVPINPEELSEIIDNFNDPEVSPSVARNFILRIINTYKGHKNIKEVNIVDGVVCPKYNKITDECDINDNGLNINYVLKDSGKVIKRL